MKSLIKLVLIVLYSYVINLAAQTKDPFPQTSAFIIESIEVEGNSKTSESVIFENLSFTVNDTVSEDEIIAGIDGLKATNFFNEVSFSPRAGSQPGNLVLTITIIERYWPTVLFKGGFSEMDSWYITPISFHFDNIFGLGNYTDLNFTIGDRISSINLNYINPNIFDSGLDFHSRIFIKAHQFLHYLDSLELKQNVPQGGISLGFRSREPFFKHFLFSLESYTTAPDSFAVYGSNDKKYYNFPEQISSFVKDQWKTSAFSIYFNWHNRDNVIYPTKGLWTGLRFSHADKQIGDSHISFKRFIFDARYYQHIYNGTVAAVRLKLGSISEEAPFYEKFYLGGPNSLRGFADRSLSPDGGGDRIYQAAMELRFPLTKKNYPNHFLTGVLFFDSGMNLSTADTFKANKIKQSAGFGLHFQLPFIGLLRMDMAYPINEDDYRIHFSLGQTF